MWKTFRNRLWRWRGILIVVPAMTLGLIGLRSARLLQASELSILDLFFVLRPAEPADQRIVLVEIDVNDVKKYRYPISDGKLAQVLNILKQQKPRAIGLSLYYNRQNDSGSLELAKVFQSTPNLIGLTFEVEDDNTKPIITPQQDVEQAQLASGIILPDNDAKIRRHFIYFHNQQEEAVFALGFILARRYLQAEGINPKLSDTNPYEVQWGKTTLNPIEHNDGAYVRMDVSGYQLMSNFRNLKSSSFRRVSLTDVLERRIPADFARDRIVLIGYDSLTDIERIWTPYSSDWLEQASLLETSRVRLHADFASQLISAAMEGRPLLRGWPEWIEWLWILVWSATGATIVWCRYQRTVATKTKHPLAKKRLRRILPNELLSRLSIAGLGLGLSVGLIGGSYLLFLQGVWVPVFPGVLAFGGSAIATMGLIALNVNSMRRMLGRYLTDQVVGNLLETPDGLNIGGERHIVTVLMSDLRGFSALSASLTPEAALATLNRYLEVMVDVITDYGGMINEILGDGIFVIFGAPTQAEDDPERAVACAIAMQLALHELNQHNQTLNRLPLEMGIGVHTGEVLAGNIGSRKRAKYAVVGKNVNLTSRIESLTVGGQVFISQDTFEQVSSSVMVGQSQQVHLKGFHQPVTVYEVYGMQGSFNLTLPKQEEPLFSLATELPLSYSIVEDKQLAEDEWPGSIVKLSYHRAVLRSNYPLNPHQNLKLKLIQTNDSNPVSGDIYAKVIQNLPDLSNSVLIRFTYIPSEISVLFSSLCSGDNVSQ